MFLSRSVKLGNYLRTKIPKETNFPSENACLSRAQGGLRAYATSNDCNHKTKTKGGENFVKNVRDTIIDFRKSTFEGKITFKGLRYLLLKPGSEDHLVVLSRKSYLKAYNVPTKSDQSNTDVVGPVDDSLSNFYSTLRGVDSFEAKLEKALQALGVDTHNYILEQNGLVWRKCQNFERNTTFKELTFMPVKPALEDHIVVLNRSCAKVYEVPCQNDQTNGDVVHDPVNGSQHCFEANLEKLLKALGTDAHNFIQNGLEWNKFQYFIRALRKIIFRFQRKITFEEFKYKLLDTGLVDHIDVYPYHSYAAVFVKSRRVFKPKYYLTINCVECFKEKLEKAQDALGISRFKYVFAKYYGFETSDGDRHVKMVIFGLILCLVLLFLAVYLDEKLKQRKKKIEEGLYGERS